MGLNQQQVSNGNGDYTQEYYAESYADEDTYDREDVEPYHQQETTTITTATTHHQQSASPSTPNTYNQYRQNGNNSSYINWSSGMMGTNEHQTYAGYLKKQGALFKQWKERYFVLDSIKHQVNIASSLYLSSYLTRLN